MNATIIIIPTTSQNNAVFTMQADKRLKYRNDL